MRDEDPEVIDDLRRRASSEREAGRSRGPAPALHGGQIVAHWACRGGCGAAVPVTEAATDAMLAFNRALRARGEAPIDTARTVFCPRCEAEGRRLRAEEQPRVMRAISERVQRLRDGVSNEESKKIQAELIKLGCNNVHELAAAIAAGRQAAAAAGRRGSLR